MPQLKLEATGELAGNWVRVSEKWSRAEMRDWYAGSLAGNDAVWLPILERKLDFVHVYTVSGDLIEDAVTLTQQFDDLDVRLVRWLATGIMAALEELLALGEASRRLLCAGVEVELPRKKTTTTTA